MKNYFLAMLVLLLTGVTLQATTIVCDEPTHIQIQRYSNGDAEMNALGSGSYDLYVKPHGGPAPTPETPGRTGYIGIPMPYFSTELLPQFDYDIWIRTNCGDGNYSDWVGPFLIATYETCTDPTGVIFERTSPTSASCSADSGTFDAWYTEAGGAGPADVWTGPNAGMNDFTSPASRNDLDPAKSYDVWIRKQCNVSQVSEWIGPYHVPLFTAPCPEPNGVVLTRTSPTTATFDGADPAYVYQGSANRVGRPLRPRPMYGMNAMMLPYEHTGLVPAFDYDVWLRTDCGDDNFSDWTGPFYLPTYMVVLKPSVSPNPTKGLLKIEGTDVVSVQVIGLTGKTELSAKVMNNEVNVSHLAPGHYVLQMTDAQGKVSAAKFIKQ